MGKNVYFLSDAHLGSLAIPHGRTQERRLVRFLDSIKEKASAVYLLGDMFDFWNEYRYVVPKGYSRFLGKLSELTDNGVEVHFFAGNHDLWTYGYLEEECGVIVHKAPVTTEIYGKVFFLAHGDGLGDPDNISWGQIMNFGKSYLETGWWICTFSGLFIMFTVLAFHMISEGINNILNGRV